MHRVNTHRGTRSLLALLVALGTVAGLTTAAGASEPESAPQVKSGKRPNIVFILTDDLDLNSYLDPSRFPKVNSLLVEKGTTFSNYFVTDSLCCPSRSSTLRGQYVHEHGVLEQHPAVRRLREVPCQRGREVDVGTWMHDAGYRTGLLGKYLNGYPETRGPDFRPAGLGRVGQPDQRRQPVLGVQLSAQRKRQSRAVRVDAAGLSRRRPVRKSSEFIQQKGDKPFFLYVAPYVPHAARDPGAPLRRRVPGRAGATYPLLQRDGHERRSRSGCRSGLC